MHATGSNLFLNPTSHHWTFLLKRNSDFVIFRFSEDTNIFRLHRSFGAMKVCREENYGEKP